MAGGIPGFRMEALLLLSPFCWYDLVIWVFLCRLFFCFCLVFRFGVEFVFFRPTPYGFRQVVQHVSNHVAYGIN